MGHLKIYECNKFSPIRNVVYLKVLVITDHFRKVFLEEFHSKSFWSSSFCRLSSLCPVFQWPVLGGFTVITELINTSLIVAFIN